VATAKALAYAAGKPLVMVDHLHGHIAAAWLEPLALDPPFVSLVASGGHTRLDLVEDYRRPALLGGAIDDPAGGAGGQAGAPPRPGPPRRGPPPPAAGPRAARR